MAEPPEPKGTPARASEVRDDILAVARDEFERNGLNGARVDAIAERTRTTKRMIYYYFGSKEGLYLAVLERAYVAVREVESRLELDALPPVDAIRRLIAFTLDHHDANAGFIRLVAIENIHDARFLKRSDSIRQANTPVIDVLRRIVDRGLAEGVFRRRIDPVDLHMLISAPCFFRVSNRPTFSALFDYDFAASGERHARLIADALVGLLQSEPDDTPSVSSPGADRKTGSTLPSVKRTAKSRRDR